MTAVEAAFFDLDKTVIARASIAAFGRPFRRGGLITRRTVARAVLSQLLYLQFGASEHRLSRVRESVLALTRGWDRERVADIVRRALLETVEPLIYAEALELMEAHRLAGDRVYLVSAAPEEIVLPLAELLGADGAIASLAEVDADGRYTGRIAFYAAGEHKATAVRELAEREGIDLSASTAYSDSFTDLPMLETVGRPVAVNADRALAKLAKERGWTSYRFTEPVRLRDRLPASRSMLATTVAFLVAGALAWWYAKRIARVGTSEGRQRPSWHRSVKPHIVA
jgi:HAD superfamily hydrolase (TIGR01490 family)